MEYLLSRIEYLSIFWFLYGAPLTLAVMHPRITWVGEPTSVISAIIHSDPIVLSGAGLLFDGFLLYSIGILMWRRAPIASSRIIVVWRVLERWASDLLSKDRITSQTYSVFEKISVRLYLVKIIFAPMMLQILCVALQDVILGGSDVLLWLTSVGTLNPGALIGLLVSVIFLVDVAWFSLGYLTESDKLGNKIISVDPTWSGWIACLVCYVPLNGYVAYYLLTSFTHAGHVYESGVLNTVVYVVVIPLLLVYVCASINMGLKASNLTYRGLVDYGVYSIVRHPAYASKVCVWWILSIPVILHSAGIFFVLIFWTCIYYARAITEERHIISVAPKEYRLYMKKVPKRFIPKIR